MTTQAPQQGDGGSVPRWVDTPEVTAHEGRVYVRLGFSEVRLNHADALVFAGEVLEACGYTYTVQRIEEAS